MNRRRIRVAACVLVFLAAGCGRSGSEPPSVPSVPSAPSAPSAPVRPRPAGPHAVLRWQGQADLDFEIWDATGQEYLRDAAGETAAADAPGGDDREEVLDLSAISETEAVIVIGVWDFGGDAESPAELEVAADSASRIFRATLTSERNLWKAFRWDPARGRIEAIEGMERRNLE